MTERHEENTEMGYKTETKAIKHNNVGRINSIILPKLIPEQNEFNTSANIFGTKRNLNET